MFRKTLLIVQILMIVGSTVWSFNPALVLADDTILDVADENLGSAPTGNTSNELEYFGTQPESASADLSEDGGPSPAPQPLNVGDDLPRTTVAAPLNPSGNVAPNCLQFFVTAYRPAEAPWDPDAPNPNPVNFPDNRLTQYQSSVAHIGWDWDFVGTVTTLPRPPLEGNWPGFPSTGVGSNPLVNPGHLFNGPAVTLPSSRVDIRTDPVGNFQAVREERLIAVIHIRNMSDLFDGTGGIDCLVDDPAAPQIFAPFSGLSQVAAGSGQSFILNSMDLHVNSDDGFGNSITHQVINLGRSNFYHSFDGVSLDNAHQIDMDPTVIGSNLLDLQAGEIERSGPNGCVGCPQRAQERFFNDVVGMVSFTVPTDSIDYLELEALNLSFSCTVAVGNCTTTSPRTDPSSTYYVVPVGGPWLYRDTEANPSGSMTPVYAPYPGMNPFETLHLVGGQLNRNAGETGWFVLEVKSHAGNGTNTQSVQRVENVTGIPECDALTDPGGGQGWYSSVTVDPTAGPIGGSSTKLAYGLGAGETQNLQLGTDDSSYCVFSRTLVPDASDNFNLTGNLLAYGYPGTGNEANELSTPINVSLTFPIAGAEISVEKVVESPLVGTPPEPDRVIPGDVVTYRITITNNGQVDVDTVSIVDSLTGPQTFPGLTLTANGGSHVVFVQHTVTADDPNPIFNVVNAYAEIVGTNILLEAFDSAAILQQDDLLGINLTVRGNVTNDINTPPDINQDTSVIYSLTFRNNTDVPMTQVYFVNITPTSQYPRLQDPGSIQTYLPNYPQFEVYSDNPPTGGSVLLIPTGGSTFLPGVTYGPIEWEFTLPPYPTNPGDPLIGYPLVQEVIMEGIGEGGEVFRGDELLVTQVTNDQVDITAQLWDPNLNAPINNNTVLRDETLTFDIQIEQLTGGDRCNVFVRMYQKHPSTGAETLLNPDLQFNWATPNQLPASSPAAATDTNTLRPTFTVQETTPDPLIIIFELDAREDCGGPPTFNPLLIERHTLVLDVSNILIDTEIQIVATGTTNQISSAFYPLPGLGDQDFEIVYRAVNNGPSTVDIIDWSYCIVNAPTGPEDCAATPAGVSMFDGQTTGFPDFGVNAGAPFGDLSRKFTTTPPRIDNRVITLVEGQSYTNPLLIQVMLRVTDTGSPSDVTIIRTFVSIPLVSDDLNFNMNSGAGSTIVRGDHNVPVNFTFQNTLPLEELNNVQVLNLMNLDGGGTAIPGGIPVTPPLGSAGPYELCTLTGVGTTLPQMANGATQSGQCLFDFTTNIPTSNNQVAFQALILATEDGTGRPVFGLGTFVFNVLPHLEVNKVGFTNGLPSDPAEYTVTLRNNSLFQFVDFNQTSGITETLSPDPGTATWCITAGAPGTPLCGTQVPSLEIEYFTNLTNPSAGTYRLAPSISQALPSVASVSYQVMPNGAGWIDDELVNTVTASGRRQYDPAITGEAGETLVSASDSFELGISCPIQWNMSFVPAGGSLGSDTLFTLGEEVTVTFTGQNIGGVPITFNSLLDPRYQQDQNPGITGTTFRDTIAQWPGAVGDLPAFNPSNPVPQLVTWTYNVRINVADFQGGSPTADRDLLWELIYDTNLGGALPGCSSNAAGQGDAGDEFGFFIFFPTRVIKLASPRVALVPGQVITYSVDYWNISETTGIQVNSVTDNLFNDRNGVDLQFNFPGDSGGVGSGIGTSGRWPAYNGTPIIRSAIGSVPATTPPFPDYVFDPAHVIPLGGEELINRVVDEIEALPGGPTDSWLDTGVPLSAFTEEAVLVRNPLVVTETVVLPTDGVVSRPGQIIYFVTVRNTSDQYTVSNITLSNPLNGSFVYPICNVTLGFDVPPIDLNATPNACLEFHPFTLGPGESDSVVATIDIPGNFPDPEVITQTRADATVNVDGIVYVIESFSQVNQVLVETPALTLVHEAYAGPTCTTRLVDVAVPDRDKNNDGIPELEVGGTFYYGFSLFVAGNRTYENVQYGINMFNGDTSLTQAAQNALSALAVAGTNPNVTTPDFGATVVISDNNNPDATVPEVTLCIPQPGGFTIPASQPDPRYFQATVSGLEIVSGEPTLFITNQDPSDDIEDDVIIDVTDPNLFISKSSVPNTAFPGETVLYTIEITNLTTNTILLSDVYDDNIGVGQQFWDHDASAATPPVPLEFHNPACACSGSIDFFKHVDTSPDGFGWDWQDLGGGNYNYGVLPPNETVSYTYERLITDVDPNPLVNRAGVIGFIDNPAPNPDTPVMDETINTLLVSNSQLNVVKTATPVTTVLGSTINYTVNITNLGDDPVYDLIVWDDRYNLQHALDGPPAPISLIPNTPAGVQVFGTEFFTSIPGASDALPDIGGQLNGPTISKTITILYTLPVPPACLQWSGAPNQPYNTTTMSTPGNTSSTCADATFNNPADLALIDPFVNHAFAVGLTDTDPGPGVSLAYLEDVGSDLASVDIINPDLQVQKIPNVSSASIGSDVTYTIRLTNTGDDPLLIQSVIDVPNSNVPQGSTDTGQLPITSLQFENCPINIATNPGGTTNLVGTQLIPQAQGGDGNVGTIQVNNTAVLPVGCSAFADIIVQVPNPLPSNEYINVVQVNAVNLGTGENVSDITSARIDIDVSGLEITKRAWNCNTASSGALTPTTQLPDGSQCTIQTSGPNPPGAMQLTLQDEGLDVWFELTLLNSGDKDLTSIQITDVMMVNQGAGLVPNTTRIANGTQWVDAIGEVYIWLNGQLILGVEGYAGANNGTCAVPDASFPAGDNSYRCSTYPNYRGGGRGPFGPDDGATAIDESYLFSPGEEFERPDPGPVDIPVITYPYTVNYTDDLDGDDRYINRARVVGTPLDPLAPDISNLDIHTLQTRRATVSLTLEACVEDDGDPNYFDPDLGNPCVTVARPNQTVWYRLTITSGSFVELENFTINGSQTGAILATENAGFPPFVGEDIQCWYDGVPAPGGAQPDFTGINPEWPGGVAGRLPMFLDTAVCTFHRNIPLQTTQDPFINTITVGFEIVTGLTNNPGTPVTATAITRIAANEILLTVPGCETGVQAMTGDILTFDVEVLNIDPTNAVNNVNVFIPSPAGTQIIPILQPNSPFVPDDVIEGSLVILPNALQIQVPPFGPPSVDYVVLASGTITDAFGTRTIDSSFTCTVQRVDGTLSVIKDVVNLSGGGTIAAPGDTVRYTITIENLDPFISITNLVVSDPLIEIEVGAGAWNAAWPQAPNDFLLPGQSITNTFDVVVTGVPDPLINTATATGVAAGVTPVLGSDSAQVDIATGDIVVTASGLPNPVVAGNNIVFTYQVCNISTTDIYDIFDLGDNDPGAPFAPALPFQLNAQECRNFTRTVPTTLADAGTTITRTPFAQGCPDSAAFICPTNLIVSDSQSANVNVISQPSDTGIIDVNLTANVLGITPGGSVNYTLTILNLNTTHTANISQAVPSQLSNIFVGAPLTLPPLGSYTQTVTYFFPGTPDPLVESVTIGYLMGNGATGTETATLLLPVATVPGATLLLTINTALTEGTPGGQIAYQYTVINIGSTSVTDAYIYDRNFIPAVTPTNNNSVSCFGATASDAWGMGHTVGGGAPVSSALFIPTLFANGFSRTATILCDVHPTFALTTPPTNLLNQVWVNRASIDTAVPANAIQDQASHLMPIVPPLNISMQQLYPAVPGGPLEIEFSVENIGPNDIDNAVLTAAVPPECLEANWLTQSPNGPGTLWHNVGVTVPVGGTVTARATCTIPDDFLSLLGVTSATFDYPGATAPDVSVDLGGVPLDVAAPIAIQVADPVEVQFIPPSNNPTLQFLRAGDVTTLIFRVTNILPPGTPVNNLTYVFDINGNTAPCENVIAVTNFGNGTFNNVLPNQGDSVDIICNYRPTTADHGTTKILNFLLSHNIGGLTIPLSVAGNPYFTAQVEHIDLEVTLHTATGGAFVTADDVNDGQTLQFTWRVRNTGQTPLTGFSFSQNMLNALDSSTVAGKASLLTPGSPAHGLLQVFNVNTALSPTCNDPLLPGETCVAQGINPLTLFASGDLNYTVLVSDPQQFLIRVLGQAVTSTGSGFTVMDTADWNGTVMRPMVQLCGNGPARATNSSGNVWMFQAGCLSINPNPVVLGNDTQISLTITNIGHQTLSNMTLTGNLGVPAAAFDGGLSLTSGLYQQIPPTTLTFTLGATSLAPGQSTTANSTWTAEGVTPPANVPFTSTFTADVPAPYAAYNVTSDATNIMVIQDPTLPPGLDPSLTEPIVVKTASAATAFPGEAVTWTITITNMSTTTMNSVDMTDAVPDALEIVSATTSSGASIVNGQLIDITTGSLAPGETVTVTINTNISPAAAVPGSITNIACGMREGGTEVCAEATVELGPGGILPDTGIGGAASISGGSTSLAQRLPFLVAIFGVFFSMLFLSLNISDRQRMGLAVLALLVMAVVISGVLLLAGGDGEEEADAPVDGVPPPDAAGVATATAVPSATPRPDTPTPPPTVAPDALATLASFPATATPYIVPTPAGPRRLDIPALNYTIPLPIVELPQINGEWDVTNLGHNIGWLDNTTWQDPLWGNTVLAGHVQLSDTDPGPFNQLHRLVPGDEIRIMEGDTITIYEVSEIFEVGPTDNSVTHPTDDPTLTLITCTNWQDSRGVFADRLVVRAIPVGSN